MAAQPLVLVVDDDAAIRQALERALRLEGFAVATAAGGRAALEAVARRPPAAIVLDVTMPDLDGRAVCARLRADGMRTPILILSARDEVEDRVAGLAGGRRRLPRQAVRGRGADRAAARAAAPRGDDADRGPAGSVGRRPRGRPGGAHVATRGGRDVDLTRREFELLESFARNAGIVLARDRLLELVWGYDWAADGNVVDVFVSYLRRKLEAEGEPRIIQTVRGVGFVLRETAT